MTQARVVVPMLNAGTKRSLKYLKQSMHSLRTGERHIDLLSVELILFHTK